MAQLATEKNRYPHLDHPQSRITCGNVAPTNGNPPSMQNLRLQRGGISATLPPRMPQGARSLGCLQKSLGQLGSSCGAGHQLALRPPWGTGAGKRGRPARATRLPCRRFLLPKTTIGHPQKLHPVPHLDRKMQKALRRPALRQKHSYTGLGGRN
ncbi:unnamed protein product [Sphagnum jensenii]|uniref:Uncharacterized protein n=1 Tax=Sphagnum jensenii TaxID=128206 RepID=A0ABP1A4S0_9BRYO